MACAAEEEMESITELPAKVDDNTAGNIENLPQFSEPPKKFAEFFHEEMEKSKLKLKIQQETRAPSFDFENFRSCANVSMDAGDEALKDLRLNHGSLIQNADSISANRHDHLSLEELLGRLKTTDVNKEHVEYYKALEMKMFQNSPDDFSSLTYAEKKLYPLFRGTIYMGTPLTEMAGISKEREELLIKWNKHNQRLVDAAHDGDFELAEYLITSGADVDAYDGLRENTSALMFAAAKGHGKIVHALLINLCKVNARNIRGRTALMEASRNGHLDIIKRLVAYGANITLTNKAGENAINLADKAGHMELVKYLESKQKRIEKRVAAQKSGKPLKKKNKDKKLKKSFHSNEVQFNSSSCPSEEMQTTSPSASPESLAVPYTSLSSPFARTGIYEPSEFDDSQETDTASESYEQVTMDFQRFPDYVTG